MLRRALEVGDQDGRQLKDLGTLSSRTPEEYFRLVVLKNR
jgi:hypothetical protein